MKSKENNYPRSLPKPIFWDRCIWDGKTEESSFIRFDPLGSSIPNKPSYSSYETKEKEFIALHRRIFGVEK